MPFWVPIVVTIAAFTVPLAERFYVRFYPDVDTQKRHLKKLAVWAFNIFSEAFQIWNLYQISREPMPTTPTGVIRIAINASIVVVLPFFLFALEGFSRMLEIQRLHLDNTYDVIGVLKHHEKALSIISKTLPQDFEGAVSKQLDAANQVINS